MVPAMSLDRLNRAELPGFCGVDPSVLVTVARTMFETSGVLRGICR
jgi:hypothetical protein